jgi:hypothetical protein
MLQAKDEAGLDCPQKYSTYKYSTHEEPRLSGWPNSALGSASKEVSLDGRNPTRTRRVLSSGH